MSKEAKVGLLLGLALIVGIVLVLRGLHGNEEAKLNKELAISSQSQVVNPMEPAKPDTVDISSAVDQLSKRPSPIIMPLKPVSNEDLEIRYTGELPGNLSGQSIMAPGPVRPLAPDPLDELKAMTEPVKIDRSIVEVISNRRPKEEKPKKQIYVVGKDENLTTIALQVYGKVEGKKYKNIQAIYKANKDNMPSIDVVYQGQKLVIPHLPGESVSVERIAGNSTARRNQSTPVKSRGQVYLVQKDDSLWDIAEAKLGSGLRYKEIKKLNGLKSDTINEGQKLRLP